MALVRKSSKKVYVTETLPLLRLLSSGIKLSERTIKDMGAKAKDMLQWAEDDSTGEVYLYLAQEGEKGNVLGSNGTFSNSGLSAKLKDMAGEPSIDVKGGVAIWFDVATTPREEEGIEFFQITFNEIKRKEEDASEGEEVDTDTDTDTTEEGLF